ncbi:MAG TPA: peroxiredoxin [Candidatus Acidoferrum sp.]|nr:peroxiredoxin [Candidatus Acidoferrum sp.]
MAIQVGSKIPACSTLRVMGEKGPQAVTVDELFAGKKVVLFAVPGAFTPGCSVTHLPGFVVLADKIKAKGVNSIICVSVNDAFVMGAWGKNSNAEEIIMLADGSADWAKACGMELDLTDKGMGVRWKRLAMIVDNGTITQLAIEPPGGIVASSAEAMLKLL